MEDILKELHSKYFKWWLKIANDITHSPRDSEEIVLSAYMTAWLRKDKFNNKTAMKQYVEMTIRSRSIDHIRSIKSSKIRYTDSLFDNDFVADSTEEIKEHEGRYINMLNIVYKIISSMSDAERRRDVMLLMLLGFDINSISRMLNISPQTVYVQKSRAMKEIKKEISKYNLD